MKKLVEGLTTLLKKLNEEMAEADVTQMVTEIV